ncbi:spore coat U domain-containing protein [Bradyrhizobium sp. LTSPM299]|uniref:Csu type fimbrial protein n=1 Tax=Bradyrhizobium sp. LTSPM299 TaxID=1619233 RepID=UPI0006798726|nr:spore coat U domain-containing protein [Bradyrhizobium sp. LTSPM299]
MKQPFKFPLRARRYRRSSPSIVLMGIVACLFATGPVVAQAGTSTATLSVSIVITAACTINPATLIFASTSGTTLITTAVNGSSTVSVTCTGGSPYSIAMDNGSNASGSQRRMISGANFLSYNLYVDAAHTLPWSTATNSTTCTTAGDCFLGTGNGAAQTVNIYGVVPTTATAPPPGTYTDTVTMTITF